jgi:hypothetical protein
MNPRPMTELLERAGETMRGLPAETQDALARILLELAGGDPSTAQLSADDEGSLKASLVRGQARR